eukprot:3971321-Amphidinium_carterae.1
MQGFRANFERSMVLGKDHEASMPNVVESDLVSRRDACGWQWQMNPRNCVEEAIEQLVRLLYPKFAHNIFTMAAFRILKVRLGGSGMTLEGSHVLLKFLWLVVILFGPCLPILNSLITLLASVYSILLFGTNAQLLAVDVTHEDEGEAVNG